MIKSYFGAIRAEQVGMSLFLLMCLIMSSCGHKDERELEEQQSSGIVLVQNRSYYEVVLPNGNSLYFSSFDEKDGISGLAFDVDSVEIVRSYGTGFFVGEDGKIATNAHVVSSSVKEKEVKKSVGDIFDAIKQLLELEYDEKVSQLSDIQDAYNYANTSPSVSYADFYTIRDIRDNALAELEEMRSTYKAIDKIVVSDAEINYHNEVSVAYNDTHVNKDSDFSECVIINTDSEHDLALLQLKSKKTPEGKYVFLISEEDPYETYSFGDKVTSTLHGDKNEKLFLHGFNLGPTLAITEEGLKAQFTSGSVSQKTADRLMYSIPALPGSSGSPVVNKDGELVAINFAGLSEMQNFNYGVRVKHLRNLLNKYD